MDEDYSQLTQLTYINEGIVVSRGVFYKIFSSDDR